MESRLNHLFATAAEEKRVPGIAAIALDASGRELYKGAYGSTDLSDPSAPPFTTTTNALFWSCTKLITCAAALQLLERGEISLDDPVEKHLPEFKNIQVLDGFQEDGTPNLRAPKTTATILHLMTHTSGFTYDFFDVPTLKWRLSTGDAPGTYLLGHKAFFMTPLTSDPGTRYCYGISTDWLGFIVEVVSGMRLHEYFDQFIFQPLGMKQSQLWVEDGTPWLKTHMRNEDASLTVNPDLTALRDIEQHGGGHALVSTLEDYSTFLLTILAGGTHPVSEVKILEDATVKEYLFTDHIPKICSNDGIGDIDRSIPVMSNVGTFLPGVKKGWSCGLMLNLEATQNGRGIGSGAWSGLGNLYYWLDPAGGKLGLVMSEIFPYLDVVVMHLADEFERAVYGHEASATIGDKDSNYHISEGIGKSATAV